MAKKKRRKRVNRLAKIKKTDIDETPEIQRRKFPKELIDTYVNLYKTKVLGTEYDFEYYVWTNKAYKLYRKEADKYLGNRSEDKLECGRLIVLLYKATEDLRDVKKTKKKSKSKTKRKIKKDS